MTLHVIVSGQGPRLALLHGWGLNSRVWDGVLPRLNETFTTVCVDLPGHGGSSWPPEFTEVDSLADAIAPQVQDADFLLGWSLGAMAVMSLAARGAVRARRLVLLAATPRFLRSENWPHGVEAAALEAMATKLVDDVEATVRDFLALQVHGDEHARPALKALREKVRDGGQPHPEALAAGLKTLAQADLRAELGAIAVPALVLSGERDRLSHPLAGQALAQALPRGQFHQIRRAAHAPFLSHADEFQAQVEQFLAGDA